jgi:predicted dinucleotide-binding enzyme
MNITILGAGNVGRALGLGFARADHMVAFGVRNPADPRHADLAATKGVRVVRLLPLARVVKAFNTIGFNVMANPIFGTQRALMYIAGNDKDAKTQVLELTRALGFEALDLGDITQARLLEPLALIWIRSAYALGLGREIGFGLLRR